MSDDQHWRWMRRAVDLAKKSVSEASRANTPRVGVVIVKDGETVAEGFRGRTGNGEHAEYDAIKDKPPEQLAGATVYTTLEPCTKRGAGKIPCAERLIAANVKDVFIGLYDPNPHIFRAGWRILRDAGISLHDFTPELRAELRACNSEFLDQYRHSRGIAGQERFDYEQTKNFVLGHEPNVTTRWSQAGRGSIHAIAARGHIALARGAQELNDIDDPGALDFDESKYTVHAREGEIVVFSNGAGTYALVRITKVLSAQRGDSHNSLEFDWELRTSRAFA